MRGRFRFLFRSIAVAAFAMFGGVSAHAAGLPRVVSINLCTDQLLLPLADPTQILGLSRFSHDAWQSWAAQDARRYPSLSGGAEDDGSVFLLHPALERFYPPSKRIVIPERLTVCGGVMLADALDVLVKELKRVSR